jgi:hypothetical protein
MRASRSGQASFGATGTARESSHPAVDVPICHFTNPPNRELLEKKEEGIEKKKKNTGK